VEAEIQRGMAQRWRLELEIFHLSTIIRRRRNSTDAIKADSRDWITSKKEISKQLVCKLRELLTEEILDFPTEMENLISSIIYAEDNASLMHPSITARDQEHIISNARPESSRSRWAPNPFLQKILENCRKFNHQSSPKFLHFW
jgi:hypothetical protein